MTWSFVLPIRFSRFALLVARSLAAAPLVPTADGAIRPRGPSLSPAEKLGIAGRVAARILFSDRFYRGNLRARATPAWNHKYGDSIQRD